MQVGPPVASVNILTFLRWSKWKLTTDINKHKSIFTCSVYILWLFGNLNASTLPHERSCWHVVRWTTFLHSGRPVGFCFWNKPSLSPPQPLLSPVLCLELLHWFGSCAPSLLEDILLPPPGGALPDSLSTAAPSRKPNNPCNGWPRVARTWLITAVVPNFCSYFQLRISWRTLDMHS